MRLILILATALLLLGATPASADLASEVSQMAARATDLAQKMKGDGTVELTWGQNLAVEDMTRLANAAAALDARMKADPETGLLDVQALVNELQTAAVRVKNTAGLSLLTGEDMMAAGVLVGEAQGMAQTVAAARRAQEERRVARRYYNPVGVSVSVGYGYGWGRPYWGGPYWGRPYYPYGYGWGTRVGWGWGGPVRRPYCP